MIRSQTAPGEKGDTDLLDRNCSPKMIDWDPSSFSKVAEEVVSINPKFD
jgi:hypothetical protein